MGCPDGERGTRRAVEGGRVRTEFLPRPQVPPFGEQPDVHLAEPGAETVGVFELEAPVTKLDGQAVVRPVKATDMASEQAQTFGVGQVGQHRPAVSGQRTHRGCPRQESAHDPAVRRVPVRPEVRKGIAATACLQGVRQQVVRLKGGHGG